MDQTYGAKRKIIPNCPSAFAASGGTPELGPAAGGP